MDLPLEILVAVLSQVRDFPTLLKLYYTNTEWRYALEATTYLEVEGIEVRIAISRPFLLLPNLREIRGLYHILRSRDLRFPIAVSSALRAATFRISKRTSPLNVVKIFGHIPRTNLIFRDADDYAIVMENKKYYAILSGSRSYYKRVVPDYLRTLELMSETDYSFMRECVLRLDPKDRSSPLIRDTLELWKYRVRSKEHILRCLDELCQVSHTYPGYKEACSIYSRVVEKDAWEEFPIGAIEALPFDKLCAIWRTTERRVVSAMVSNYRAVLGRGAVEPWIRGASRGRKDPLYRMLYG